MTFFGLLRYKCQWIDLVKMVIKLCFVLNSILLLNQCHKVPRLYRQEIQVNEHDRSKSGPFFINWPYCRLRMRYLVDFFAEGIHLLYYCTYRVQYPSDMRTSFPHIDLWFCLCAMRICVVEWFASNVNDV